MIRHIVRHRRLFFFAAIYLVYLVVLFAVSGVRDPGHPARTIARFATAAVELALFGMLCAACVRMARRGWRVAWLVLSGTIAALAGVVYLAQAYSLYLSDNFISILALQNTDSVAFIGSPLLKIGAAGLIAWVAMFCMADANASTTSAQARGGSAERWGRTRFALTISCLAVVFVYLSFLQNKNRRLEPGFRQAPIVNLLANVYRADIGEQGYAEEGGVALDSGAACFDYGGDPKTSPYPFQQTRAYRKPLPFAPQGRKLDKPNVVVIFSEGTSTRLIGAYGGHYPQLTPNIDGLAKVSMRVDDYFNHTAATYRGLSGQLSSGYSFEGGGGEGGWETADRVSTLSGIRRQTLPLVANASGYDSYFFAPHREKRPIIKMLYSLGFEKVFAYEPIATELLDGKVTGRSGTSGLDDKSLFRGLVQFLKNRDAAENEKPFLVGLYNIGTHAFLASAEGEAAYGDGENAVLDKLHNFDSTFGEFLRYFYDSPYADNTILIFTSDHATYPEPPFRAVAGPDLKPYFVDRIPLLIRDPLHRLPTTFDAQGRNSLDLAPTALQLAGMETRANSFMGKSLFEPRNFPTGVAATGSTYFMTTPDGVFGQDEIPPALKDTFDCEINVVRRFYQAERDNRIFRASEAGS